MARMRAVRTYGDAVERIKEQLETMSTAMLKATFSAATMKSSLTGLRAVLDAEKWKFGTVHRNKASDERVMVVGYRQVTGLRDSVLLRRGWANGVGDTVENWFDYWEVEPDT